MRFDILTISALLGLADSLAVAIRDDHDEDHSVDDKKSKPWQPKTKDPHFFNIKVNDKCDRYALPAETDYRQCPLENYAIRLEKGIVIATPYNKWWDPKLPTFFVDDDTQLYTVSKDPLQVYIDSVTGAVKYTKVGWLPPSAISNSFYHTGNNPLQLVDPSPSYLTWPSTMGIAFNGFWAFCPLGETGQYQLFVNNRNFEPQGVQKDQCIYKALAAVNANPWRKDKHYGHNDNYGQNNGYGKDYGYGKNDGYGKNEGYGKNDGYGKEGGYGKNDGYGEDDGYSNDDGYGQNDRDGKDSGYGQNGGYSKDGDFGKP